MSTWKRPGENNPRLSHLQAIRANEDGGGRVLDFLSPSVATAPGKDLRGVFGFCLKSSEKPEISEALKGDLRIAQAIKRTFQRPYTCLFGPSGVLGTSAEHFRNTKHWKFFRNLRRIADKWAAIVWMCRNQLGRRNITDEQKTVLIGEAYKAQKNSVGNHAERGKGGKYLKSKLDSRYGSTTGGEIAKKFGVGYGTVLRAEHYVDGLNAAEEISPGIKDAVLSGAIKAPKQMIAETATETATATKKPQQ